MRDLFRPHTEQPTEPTGAIIAVPVRDLHTEDRPRFYLLPDLYHWQRGQWVTNVGDKPLTHDRYWWVEEARLLAWLENLCEAELQPPVEHPAPCPHCGADHDELGLIEIDAGNWAVTCDVCGAIGPSDTEEPRAIALWGGAARRALEKPSHCVWECVDDENEIWGSTCGVSWSFIEGDPMDNNMHHCPGCGKNLYVHRHSSCGDNDRLIQEIDDELRAVHTADTVGGAA